jgi:hypothetical protein
MYTASRLAAAPHKRDTREMTHAALSLHKGTEAIRRGIVGASRWTWGPSGWAAIIADPTASAEDRTKARDALAFHDAEAVKRGFPMPQIRYEYDPTREHTVAPGRITESGISAEFNRTVRRAAKMSEERSRSMKAYKSTED